MGKSIALAFVFALLPEGPALATQAHLQTDEIVVTGEKAAQAERQARAYIREIGVAAGDRQAARWIVPICPHVTGLSKEMADLVDQGIRKNAADVGAPVAPRGCRGNLVVAFTDDGEAVVKHMTRLDSLPTRKMTPTEARAFKAPGAPARWWYATGLRSRDGQPETSVMAPHVVFTDLSGNRVDPPLNDRSTILPQYTASLISTMGARGIEFAAVVIDAQQANGATLASVIDYASMVGLAEVRMGASVPGSILSLFEADASQRRLSRRDLAFLKGLYRITMDRKAEQQRRSLVSHMVKESAAAN